ncbi:Scr1 family TA system antitoxin-like transcriptional regulator [Streptomyces rubiginosohelvolus]|uniref:Scr1 family TA system antitoxin-like transcriptional regulator n=1 Tax=Streptomyces rubiginosohelvolus TaxID=67362 RepID=UPI0033B6DBB8
MPLGRLCPPEKGGCSAHAHFAARAQYVGQEDGTFHILLAEQALNIPLGGPEFMRGQLRRLVDAMDLPGLPLGIIEARAPTSEFILEADSRSSTTTGSRSWDTAVPRRSQTRTGAICSARHSCSATPLPSTVRLPGI